MFQLAIIEVFVDSRLRALMEMCILIPGVSPKLHQNGGTNSKVIFASFRILSPEHILVYALGLIGLKMALLS